MRNLKGKRAWALILAVVIAASIASCGRPVSSEGGPQSKEGALFSEPTEISIAMSSDPTWPNNNNWKLWQYMREATGATFKVQAIPTEEFFTKVSLMMASPDSLPDLLHITQKRMVDQYATTGAFAAFDDNMDKLPNYQKFLKSLPEKESKELIDMRKSADGKLYNAPAYGTQTVNNARAWMYRKDVFEKHNLKIPQTYDELYEVCKQLKKLYPNSYPLCFRDGFTKLRMMGPQWKPYLSFDVYYDFNSKKWCYGATDPETREMVVWLSKMREEGLTPPDMIDIKSKTWEELMTTDRGFITLDYIVRVDFFNLLMQKQQPTYNLAVMQPPMKNANEGYHKMCKINIDMSGYAICNTGDKNRMNNAFKMVDWMYTDEAEQLLGWGKEGETFEMKDGRRQFILPKQDDTPRNLYGISSFGLYQRLPVDAYESTYSKAQIDACREATQYLEDYVNPMWWLSFTDDESKRITDLDLEISDYTKSMISKFIQGQEPISKWDQFVADFKEFNLDEYLGIYDTAYKRVVK